MQLVLTQVRPAPPAAGRLLGDHSDAPRTFKLAATLACLVLAATALAGCATTPKPSADPAVEPVHSTTPTPSFLTELPEWAKGTHWLIYPDDFECMGTEGCPNDYRFSFGEPGPVLPENVEYYVPEKHDCVLVRPAGVTC